MSRLVIGTRVATNYARAAHGEDEGVRSEGRNLKKVLLPAVSDTSQRF